MNNLVHEKYTARLQNTLHDLLNSSDIPATRVKDAIEYVLFPGGKRLRPMLVYLCGELLDVNVSVLDIIASAIELIHCYSLIHDDLPAMDNDDLRRGIPTCHRAFDEATAILVGDGMQALAIEILLSRLPYYLSDSQVLKITHTLVHASGIYGMVSGQSLDLSELTNPALSETTLCQIHHLKTGRLIMACIEMVLIASQATPQPAAALREFSQRLGLVFQMQDDYLDCYGQLGKGRSSDHENHKITFASLYDQQSLANLIETHFQQALHALACFEANAMDLQQLVLSLQQRQ